MGKRDWAQNRVSAARQQRLSSKKHKARSNTGRICASEGSERATAISSKAEAAKNEK